MKPKGECITAITDGIALKAIASALVQDPDLEARAALETNHLLIDSKKVPRQPHAACLLVQFVKKRLNQPQWICLLTLLRTVTDVQQGEVSPEVFPATLPTDLLTLTHVHAHRTCVLVIAKERLLLLPLKPVFKLGLWGWAICAQLGMLATCRQRVGDVSICHKFWLNMCVVSDTR